MLPISSKPPTYSSSTSSSSSSTSSTSTPAPTTTSINSQPTTLKGLSDGIDLPGPAGWLQDRFEDGVEAGGNFLGNTLDQLDELREKAGDVALDKALGIDADRIDSLEEGDKLVIGGDLNISAEISGGLAVGVTLERTGSGEYTATVNADVLAGLGFSDTDLSGAAGGTAEFTFSSKEEALQGLQALGKMNVLGLTVTKDEIEALSSNLSAIQVDSSLAAGLGARVGLDDIAAQGAGLSGTQGTSTRIELEDGVPTAVVVNISAQTDASAVSEALGDQLPLDGEYGVSAESGAELRFPLPELEGDSLKDKFDALFEGEGRITYALPEVTVHAQLTGTKDGSGALASIEGTLRPGELGKFFKQLADGNVKDAFGAVASVEGHARTWEDDAHPTDVGGDFVVGSANFDNYTRHYGDDHSFVLGRDS